MIELLEINCMDYMKTQPDNAFDLAICDPPYFSGPEKPGYYEGKNNLAKGGNYMEIKTWKIPIDEYFAELFRVSLNQIIWGINYFKISLPGGRIVWTKAKKPGTFSQCEIAYHSFYKRVDLFEYLWNGFWQENMKKKEKRIHPVQKPIALYAWLLENYAEKGQRILDTHGGSFSSAIAAHYFGCDFVGCEIDPYYYKAGKKRFNHETRQISLLK